MGLFQHPCWVLSHPQIRSSVWRWEGNLLGTVPELGLGRDRVALPLRLSLSVFPSSTGSLSNYAAPTHHRPPGDSDSSPPGCWPSRLPHHDLLPLQSAPRSRRGWSGPWSC